MVTPNGSMVIYQKWNQPQSMSTVFSEVVELCGTDLVFELKIIPHPKLPRTLLNFLSCFISKCPSFVGKSGFRHVIQIKHREKASLRVRASRGACLLVALVKFAGDHEEDGGNPPFFNRDQQ
jgi:hypothetical protein